MKGNRQLIRFAAKALAIYALWYVAYDLWLLPDGRLDAWLSHNVAAVSGDIMSLLGYEAAVSGRSVRFPGVDGVYIANGCNGLTTVGLFIGFVVAYPGKTVRRLLFIPAGIFAIYLVNVLRIVVMLLAQAHWPAAFDPLHGFGLTTIFYVLVFGLWVLWANYGGETVTTTAPPPAAAA
jgi:exosortase family protein XrtF